MNAESVIVIEGVKKAFGAEEVLRGVTLSIPRGRITTVLGKSGAGKSVLMKCVAGLIRPDAGIIRVNGEAFGKDHFAIPSRLSYMFQNNALLDGLTAFENVALPLQEKTRMRGRAIRQKVRELFERLDLRAVDGKYPSQLSGGMQKRVALARALATDPEIIIFDEPTTGLDPLRKVSVLNMIERYHRHFGFTAVLVSHDLPDSLFISDKVAVLDRGRIVYEGDPLGLQMAAPDIRDTFLQTVESLRNEVVGLGEPSSLPEGRRTVALDFPAVGERRPDESGASPNLRAAQLIRIFRRALPAGWELTGAGPWSVAAVSSTGVAIDTTSVAEALREACRAQVGDRRSVTYPVALLGPESTRCIDLHLPFPTASHDQTEN